LGEDGRVEPGRSVSFDRAAGFYDRTRALDPAVAAAQTAMLADHLATAPGPALEIGVGTGRIALPLAEAGALVVGVDLSAGMVAELRAKDRAGRVPVVLGDAAALPFAGESFGAAVACHVLHLVADWVAVVAELRRVLRPGGVLLATRGAAREGLAAEVTRRIRLAAGAPPTRPVGLDQLDELDDHVAATGGTVEHLAPIERTAGGGDDSGSTSVAAYLDHLGAGIFSWTWDLPPDRLATAVGQVRDELTQEHGDLSALLMRHEPIRWHRYVLRPAPGGTRQEGGGAGRDTEGGTGS
jgi:SAM-dependent methyltransferase